MITFSCTPCSIPVDKSWIYGPHNRRMFRVSERIIVRENGAWLCHIEPGFLSDGISWPPIFKCFTWIRTIRKWLRDKYNKRLLSALLHDHLLQTTNKPKWEVDLIFYKSLRSLGVSALESSIYWCGVRVIGR